MPSSNPICEILIENGSFWVLLDTIVLDHAIHNDKRQRAEGSYTEIIPCIHSGVFTLDADDWLRYLCFDDLFEYTTMSQATDPSENKWLCKVCSHNGYHSAGSIHRFPRRLSCPF